MLDSRSKFRRIRARAQARATATVARLAGTGRDFGKLFESLPAIAHSINPTGHILRATPPWLALLEYPRQTVLGRPWVDFLSPQDRSHALEVTLPALLRTGTARDIPCEYITQSGRSVHVTMSSTGICDVAGRPEEILIISRDVTERREAEERLSKVVAAAQCLLWTATVEREASGTLTWTIDAVDDSAAQSFFPVAPVSGGRWTDAWYHSKLPEDRERIGRNADEAFASGAGRYSQEFRCRRIDGAICWFREDVHIEPLGDARWRAVGVCVDVTALKRAEEELLRAKTAAEEASRAKSTFLANMSHEIRTPMTAILGYTEMLQDASLQADQRAAFLRTIRRNGDHLLEVINDILDLSKIEASKLTLEPAPCDLIGMLEDVRASLLPRAAEKKVALRLIYESTVPRQVRTDPMRVRGILMNLVGNAVKFTEAGTILVRARLHRDAGGPVQFEVAVQDTGIGIAPAALATIFEPFVQADTSTTRVFGGTGLGLAISRKIARALGGEINVTSTQGVGSTFTFTLPLATQDVSEEWVDVASDPPPPETTPAQEAPTAATGGRVLLVEDSPDNQAIITHLLTRSGVNVTLAENGRVGADTAMAAMHGGHPFDLILMDMQMPVLDGYQAAATLRAHGYKGPIVALTANAMAGDREKCLRAGCDDYATKPIDVEHFLELVRRYTKGAVSAPAGPAESAGKTTGSSDVYPQADSKLESLLQRFLEGLPRRINVMRQSLITQDFETLRRLIHQFKGAAGSYGFPSLTNAATLLEQSVRLQHDVKSVSEELGRLAAMCDQTVAARRR